MGLHRPGVSGEQAVVTSGELVRSGGFSAVQVQRVEGLAAALLQGQGADSDGWLKCQPDGNWGGKRWVLRTDNATPSCPFPGLYPRIGPDPF